MVKLRTYEPGQVIIREGEHGDSAYFIHSGRVEVTKTLEGKSLHLAYLGDGEIFGEMSMVDEKPRSATVTVIADSEITEIHRDDFFHSFQTDPQIATKVLSGLFERLREADRLLLEMQKGQELHPAAPIVYTAPQKAPTVMLQAMTSTAVRALSEPKLTIKKFPFRIGRRTSDPLVQNDLEIPDNSPWQVSRNHLAIILKDGKIGVVDRGSHLGSTVNGHRIGGHGGRHDTIFIEGNEAEIWLGTPTTEWRYKLFIE
jgi:CRP-like cAMP-binding protein